MHVPVPRLGQLARSVTLNLADTFWYNNTVTSMRRDCQWDPFGSRASLLSPVRIGRPLTITINKKGTRSVLAQVF